MKILLTGGSGMVGKNFLEHPLAASYEIVAPTSGQLNLLKKSEVLRFLKTEAPDLIVHAAGRVGGIQANMSNPVAFLRDNVEMGVNIIGCADACDVPQLINLGSSCMYPREARNPLDVSALLQGPLEPTNEGYALAKIVSSRMCRYIMDEKPYREYKTIIPCNLYGRHDTFDGANAHLIPAVISKIHIAKAMGSATCEIWGDGSARREFMLASDLAGFLFYAIQNLNSMPKEINVGHGYDYSIDDYYNAVAEVVGYNGEFEHDLTKPVGMRQKLVDVSAMRKFGWESERTLFEGIQEVYEFFQGNYQI